MRPSVSLFLTALLGLAPVDAVRAAPVSNASHAVKVELKVWQLANGLQVIFCPHRKVPAVTVQLWYHVGSKDERVGVRGVAHMFEHMMFKGSRHVRPEEHARMISAVGGNTNAFTSEDVTAYHNTLPRQYLDFALRLEADRMRHFVLTDQTIASEREVVKEEKRLRLENSPIGRSLEAIHALSFTRHSYAWTPAGEIADLNQTKKDFYQRFYDTYYVPNNATLIVVGDVDEQEVRKSVARYFDPVPKGKAPPRVSLVEPAQTALREKRADWPSQLNVVLGAYHIPEAKHPDFLPLQVLSTILSGGRASRLYQTIVRKGKLALEAGGFAMPREHPGLFFVYGVGLPNHDLEKLRAALFAELSRVTKSGVTAKELEKAKNQLATQHLRGLRTLYGLAYQIGMSTYLEGDPGAFLTEVKRLERVTTKDVQRVAGTYLTDANLNLLLLPASSAKAKGGAR
ncbi:MAG: insulinase family protein [Deltaproteobacteria bacterium]|nr:insulinase family protein [Deltaproteobacteria bacterium]